MNNQTELNEKKNNSKKILLLACVVILIVAAIILFLKKHNSGTEEMSFDNQIKNSESFFLENKDGNYALFNIGGEKLSEFGIKPVNYEFLNGAAIVKDKNNKYGVISSSGKMVVDFGEYEYISREGALYSARDKDSNKVLFNSRGKIIKKDKEISYAGSLLFIDTLHTFTYDDEKYTLYNYDGKEIMTFPKVEDKIIKTERKDNYLSVNYNNTEYIVDLAKAKVIASFPTNRVYYLGDYNKEKSGEFILYDNGSDDTSYILVRDGKVAYEINEGNILFSKGLVLLNNNGNQSILNEKGEIAFDLHYTLVKDLMNYAVLKDGQVVIYVDGKEKTIAPCKNISNYSNGVYLLENCDGSKDYYYSEKGEKMFDEGYLSFSNFDKSGHAIVSVNDDFYLIDKSGKKVGESYKHIYLENHSSITVYTANKDDNSEILLDEKGKELISGDKIYLWEIRGNVYAEIIKDDEYELLNVNTKKTVGKFKTKIDRHNNYFIIDNSNKKQYYSYTTGKMFFEE